jgi:hypothetical protein
VLHEHAVHGEAVAAHRVVDHRGDAVVLVDVLDPARRDVGELADRVHAHRLEERHVLLEHALDEVIGLRPQRVAVVGADGRVAPVHALDEEVLAVDLQLVAELVVDHLGGGRPGGRGERGDQRERQDDAEQRPVHDATRTNSPRRFSENTCRQ